ncbi:VOC family protein [Aquihabitans sp. McL0605]|uniref:VOC family protein n=1 Tax=Aquihabitans sp. McL0605 TaxID=3415671 RepID=UPI003CEE58C8
MGAGAGAAGPGPRLVALQIADDPSSWAAAGFTVIDGSVVVGSVRLELTGRPADGSRRGITGWTVSGLAVTDGHLDGLPTSCRSDVAASDDPTPGPHPNGVTGLDHVVVATPDLDRTIDALAGAGLELRRIRDTTSHGAAMRQAFFRLGPTILEVVSGDTGSGRPAADAPATWFGLAVDVDDLDETAAFLGDGLGSVKVAVQEGRRIATLRHKHFGLSVAVAAMDHHGGR